MTTTVPSCWYDEAVDVAEWSSWCGLCGKAGSNVPARGTCQGRSLKHICCGQMMAWLQIGQLLACHMCRLPRLSCLGMRSPTTHPRSTYLLRFVRPALHPSRAIPLALLPCHTCLFQHTHICLLPAQLCFSLHCFLNSLYELRSQARSTLWHIDRCQMSSLNYAF